MRALGLTCGIGSMLVGARQAGFDVVGNVEWRNYYHKRDEAGRNTFTENFPGAFMVKRLADVEADVRGVDLVMGHPECGRYSKMNNINANFRKNLKDPGDIPLFVDMAAEVAPRFLVMDDLPRSFVAFGPEEYHARLPDYDLFFEWVSNYHYGNVQKHRNRLFLVAARKEERYTFVPGEAEHALTVAMVIGDVVAPGGPPNNEEHVLDVPASKGQHMRFRGDRATWREVRNEVRDKPEGWVLHYHAENGGVKTRLGFQKGRWDGHAYVLDGGSPCLHALKGVPLSVRERAKIQGFPDDFVFYGTRLEPDGRWNHDRNVDVVKQTGKAMPVQFNRYVAAQIRAHDEGRPFECSGERLAKSNAYVDDAKRWYCRNVGYSEQEHACDACWMRNACGIRYHVYGIGDPEPLQDSLKIQPKTTRPKREEKKRNGKFTGTYGNF